jgi:hypothetical protein
MSTGSSDREHSTDALAPDDAVGLDDLALVDRANGQLADGGDLRAGIARDVALAQDRDVVEVDDVVAADAEVEIMVGVDRLSVEADRLPDADALEQRLVALEDKLRDVPAA